ncbi:CAP domain-containing protein [Paenibacillus abyssi]|uniref:LysM domain-containing protein n=1 Tax=Paenibacillus abyssi TaxID=1340531 RepID=A0A917FPY1_9BACL|nr:CAP domain-containing protein [Paenibacillus abyssi]GGF96604.1 hypothetical protein GCM10010916_12300 [Paenibacillus abyssi]
MKKQLNRGIAGMLVAGMIVAGGGVAAKPVEAAAAVNAYPYTYTITSGDSLYQLANKYGVDLDKLIASYPLLNNPNWKPVTQKPVTQKPVTQKPVTQKPVTQKPVNTPPAGNAGSGSVVNQDAFAAQVVKLVNQERAKAGLPALVSDPALTRVAMDKAKDMYNNNYFSHTSPTYGSPFDMMRSYGIQYSYAGENIASGQQSPQQVMNSWMNSSGHRANIMSKNFKKIGVAYYKGEWVQMFIA